MPRSNFNREVAEAVLELLKLGHTHQSAAHSCGLSVSSLYYWRRRGEEPDATEDYKWFAENFVRATGIGILAIERNVLAQACQEGEGELGLKVLGRRRWRDWGQQAYRLKQLEREVASLQKDLKEVLGRLGNQVAATEGSPPA